MTNLTQTELQALEVLAAARKLDDDDLHEVMVRAKQAADARLADGSEEEAWLLFNLATLLGCVGAERLVALSGMRAQLDGTADA